MASSGTAQIVNPAGGCCPCSEQVGCSCGPPPCSMVCESRTSVSGLATFCGFAEFGTPSNPPVYYRTMNLSGGFGGTGGANNGCTIPSCSASATYSGANSYDKTTCALTEAGSFVIAGCRNAGPLPRLDISGADLFWNGVTFGFTDLFTTTTHQLLISGACVVSGSGFADAQISAMSALASLGDLDQADDAIARAVAGRAWTGTDCSKNFSSTTQVLAGQRTFAFIAAQVQVSIGLPIPGVTYNVQVTLGERAVGTVAPLTPFGLLAFSITAPPAGPAISAYQQIPNAEGLEIHATGCAIVSTS